jgi:hypothetical protein
MPTQRSRSQSPKEFPAGNDEDVEAGVGTMSSDGVSSGFGTYSTLRTDGTGVSPVSGGVASPGGREEQGERRFAGDVKKGELPSSGASERGVLGAGGEEQELERKDEETLPKYAV